LGHTVALLRDHLGFMNRLPLCGDLVQIRLGPLKVLVVSSPDLTRQLLLDDATFDKGGPLFDRVREALGNGLLTCPHADHRRQRRLLQPSFHRARLPGYAKEMSENATEMVGAWIDGQLIDVTTATQQITARSLAATIFANALPPDTLEQTLQDIDTLWVGWARRVILPATLGRFPTPGYWRYRRAGARFRQTVSEVLARRRNNGTGHGDDLISLLLAVDAGLSDTEIYEQMMTLLAAGIETTASTIAWALYLLACYPEIQRQLNDEVDTVLQGGMAAYEHVSSLRLTNRIVTETLRLYPAPWFVTRTATIDTLLGGHAIPAGTALAYSPFALHHRSDLFPQPERFDPDRWLPENDANIPPGAFVPFGHGARKCAGDAFAVTQAILVLASLSARWWVELGPDLAQRRPPRPPLGVSLKPPKLPLRVLARTGDTPKNPRAETEEAR
jgi:pentalenene oxygenase